MIQICWLQAILTGRGQKRSGQFSYQIVSQSTKTNRSRIFPSKKFLFKVPFSLSVFWFLLLSQFIGQKFTNWRLGNKTQIFILDLENFQFWHFKNLDPAIFRSIFLSIYCLSSIKVAWFGPYTMKIWPTNVKNLSTPYGILFQWSNRLNYQKYASRPESKSELFKYRSGPSCKLVFWRTGLLWILPYQYVSINELVSLSFIKPLWTLQSNRMR